MNLPARVLEHNLAGNILSLILLSSERCNLRCTYCYEDHATGPMNAHTVRGVKNLLHRRFEGLDRLSISWFGGEPLLALNIVREIMRHVQAAVEERGIRFSSNMTTNAYLLTRPVFEELLSLGVRGYQIAFDGPRDWHDRRRVLPDGHGTFDRIWSNVCALKEVDGRFKVIIRIHVDKDNRDAVPGFIDQCAKAFDGDDRFKMFIRPLSRLGGRDDERINELEHGMNDGSIAELRQRASCLGMPNYRNDEEISVCYAARANCFVIRADGRVNKCTVALERRENQVGRLSENGDLNLDKHLMLKWMRGLSDGDRKVLHCPLNGLSAQP